MESAAGVSTIKSTNAAAASSLTFENIQSAITAVTLANDVANASNTVVGLDYDASAISGTSDDVAITSMTLLTLKSIFQRMQAQQIPSKLYSAQHF